MLAKFVAEHCLVDPDMHDHIGKFTNSQTVKKYPAFYGTLASLLSCSQEIVTGLYSTPVPF